jgi:hypothetical protein
VGYKGNVCCPNDYLLHVPVPISKNVYQRLFHLNATAMEAYSIGIMKAMVVNIGAPFYMAYDARGELDPSLGAPICPQWPRSCPPIYTAIRPPTFLVFDSLSRHLYRS